jgi:hypothetical protein
MDLEDLPVAVVAPALRLGTRVGAISRLGYDRIRSRGRESAPFLLRLRTGAGEGSELTARAVIDASGTWNTPNVLGANGLPARGEDTAAKYIVAPCPTYAVATGTASPADAPLWSVPGTPPPRPGWPSPTWMRR